MRRLLVLLAVGVSAGCAGGGDAIVTTTASPAASDLAAAPTVAAATTVATEVPVTTAAPPADGSVVLPAGFERVQATVTTADGEVCDLCLWLAATNDQRSLGLMRVTDLGPADGMAFVYPTARTGNFWMKNTVLPLSIAFFDATGAYLDAFDMEPCEADPCPLYRTAPDFVVAVETTQGDLPELGIGPGSMLVVSDLPCLDG